MSKIKFGIVIPQGWRNDLPPKSVTEQFKYSRDIVIAAEKNGFDSAYAYDHFIPHYRYPTKGNFFECYTLLSALSTFTKRIKIGQIVTCNSYRNPALLAKITSTLDVISHGRSELGIGAGWYGREYASYGYDFPSHVTRIDQLDEALTIDKAMWSNERSPS